MTTRNLGLRASYARFRTTRLRVFLASCVWLCGCSSTTKEEAPAQTIRSSFDLDDEGWTVADFVPKSNYQSAHKVYEAIWSDTGGEQQGHIFYDDLEHLSFFFRAPAKFHGDKAAYIGGRLRWFSKTNVNDWPDDGFVVIAGGGDTLYFSVGAIPKVDEWVERSVPLTHDGWTLTQPNGEAADETSFAAVLADVTELQLPGEAAKDLVESTALDEVSLEGPDN